MLCFCVLYLNPIRSVFSLVINKLTGEGLATRIDDVIISILFIHIVGNPLMYIRVSGENMAVLNSTELINVCYLGQGLNAPI